MPSEERIDSIVDLAALEAEIKKTVSLIDVLETKIETVSKIKVSLQGAESFKALSGVQKQLAKEGSELIRIEKDIEKSHQRRIVLQTELGRKLAEEKEQVRQVTAENKNYVRELNAAEGSIEQYRATLIRLQKEYDNLSKAERDAGKGSGLKDQINGLAVELKKLEAEAGGRFQRNVGNYANAFGGAFVIVKKQLEDVRKAIASGEFSGDALDGLIEKEKVLTSVTEKLSQNFQSTREQSRAFQESAAQIGVSFGQQSEVFQKFSGEVGQGVDALNDIRDSIKLAASDTRLLDQLVSAANGIAGAYGAAQGAAALFAGDNEDLQKTFVKLQAVMAILNGLQAVQNELKNKESLLLKVVNFARGQETKGLVVNTAATQAQAVATRSATTATGGLTLGMKALRTALITTGIGAIVVAIGYLISFIDDWVNADEKAIESQKKLSEAMAGVLAAQQAQADAIREQGQRRIKTLEDEAAKRKALGVTQAKQIADEMAIEKERENLAAKEIARRNITQKQQDNFYERYTDGLEKINQLNNKAAEAAKRNDFAEVEKINKQIEANKVGVDNLRSAYESRQNILDDYTAAQRKQELLSAQLSKLSADEQREALADNARRTAELTIDQNNRILADEKSTQAERLRAIKSTEEERRKIVTARVNAVLTDPTVGPAGRVKAERDANAEIIKLERDSQQQQENVRKQYNERRLRAAFDILKLQNDEQIAANDRLIDSEKSSYEQRITALAENFNRRKEILLAERELALSAVGLTGKERTAIEERYLAGINALEVDFGDKQIEIIRRNGEKAQAEIERFLLGRQASITEDQARELIALDEAFKSGSISAEKYGQERSEIEKKYRIQNLQADITATFGKLATVKKGTDEELRLRKQLAEQQIQLSSEVGEKELQIAQQVADKKKQLASEGYELFKTLVLAQFDNETNALQDQIDLIDEKTKKEIDGVNASLLSEQDKANRISVINIRAQKEREQLERKQRQVQLEKARFEKAANIASIISTTALAIIKTLAENPGPQGIGLAALIGAIGAVQLAKAIATPLPKFKAGTKSSPEGWALTDEAGAEMYREPSGKTYVGNDSATLRWLPRGTEIIPAGQWENKASLAENVINGYSATPSSASLLLASGDRALLKEGNDLLYMLNDTLQRKKLQVTNVVVTEDAYARLKREQDINKAIFE
jgi:hypothetical protein